MELKTGEGFTFTIIVSSSEHPFAVIVKKYGVKILSGVALFKVSLMVLLLPELERGVMFVTAFLNQVNVAPLVAELAV